MTVSRSGAWPSPKAKALLWGMWLISATLLLTLAYGLNLGSLYAPSNGDEMVYLHIARLTHQAQAWLPLVSDLQTPAGLAMRNTKPPLLFWQAMAAGAHDWQLASLRWPYVVQTLLCAALLGWLTRHLLASVPSQHPNRLSNNRHRLGHALLAATLYLGFFSSYRYGRTVLPSATESLFLFALVAAVVAHLHHWRMHPWPLGVLGGVLVLPALWVKSFVLVIPVALWLLALMLTTPVREQHQQGRPYLRTLWRTIFQSLIPAGVATVMGLAGFALWLAIDPQPLAVWQEFVVGENFSTKFSASRSDSLWALWLGPLLNAGLLMPLVLGLLLATWRFRTRMPLTHRALWLWVLAWLVVFSLPSQRSARYIIPVMPALAVLIALYAKDIAARWWRLTSGLIALATALVLYTAWQLSALFPPKGGYTPLYFAVCGLVLIGSLAGMFYPFGSSRYLRRATSVAALGVLWLVLLGGLSAPFDAASFDLTALKRIARPVTAPIPVQVPSNFNASWERYYFVLRGLAHPQPEPNPQAPWVIRLCPLRQTCPLGEGEQLLGSRLVLRSRQSPQEVNWAALRDLPSLLVETEVLVQRLPPPAAVRQPPHPPPPSEPLRNPSHVISHPDHPPHP